MIFNRHLNLSNKHALFGASKYHWIRYTEDEIRETFSKRKAVEKGIELHTLAALSINNGIKLPKTKKTLNMYVNDAIGYKMKTEQPLYFSDNFFGTADAICFRNDILRIHDLKTGVTPAHMEQLMIYAALFCLEYKIKPSMIKIELRLYQNNDILGYEPEAKEVLEIMNKIMKYDKIIDDEKLKYL